MKRPLAAVVVAYGTGLLLGRWLSFPFVLVLVLLLGLFFKRHRRLLIYPLLALVGWLNFAARTAIVSQNDLRQLLGGQPAMVTLRGTLAGTPHLKIVEHDGQEKWRTVAQVNVRELQHGPDFQPAVGEVLVTTPDELGPAFFSGQPVQISGVIAPPPFPLAEGMFDFRQYLATRGIYYQLRTESTNDWKLLDPHRSRPPATDRFLGWSRQTLALGLPAEDEPLRLLWAMTLGWRAAFAGDVTEPFIQAGTFHLFAIDGLRIAMLSGMMVALLRVARLSRAWCGLVAVPVIWFYTAATGWEPSAVRASVMMTVVLGGWAMKRPADLLNSLAAAALIILLWDSRQLAEAGFLLSFGVMLVIALLLPPLNAFCDRWIDRLLAPDPLLPEPLVPAWRKRAVRWSRRFAHFCALSFVAWLGSLPLAAKYFHLVSPVSTLANIPAVLLGAFALMANLGALICGHWLAAFTGLFNHAAWFFMSAMTWVSAEAARLPGAYFYVPEPSLITIVLYYAIIVAAGSGWFHSGPRKIAGAAVLLLIAAGYGWQWQSSRGETDLTVLPLGGGHAVYVDAAGRRNDWLINCGSEDAVELTLKNYLRGQGVNFVPRLALSDASARNCGGVRRLDELFGVGELWTSDAKFRSPAYRAAVAGFESASNSPDIRAAAAPGMRRRLFHFGESNGCWQVLFPATTANGAKAGDAALVLRGSFHGTRILLLSDLSRAGQSDLLAQTNDLRAAIVIAGLPDDGEPLCNDLIAAIQPRLILIADSEYPAARRASRALRERLGQTGIPVVYTREAGAVKIITTPSGWQCRTRESNPKAECGSLCSGAE